MLGTRAAVDSLGNYSGRTFRRCAERRCGRVPPGGDAAEILEATEQALDEVALAVGHGVVRDQRFAAPD